MLKGKTSAGTRMSARTWLALSCWLLLAGCGERLYGDLTEAEANEMRQALAQRDIEARRVPQDDGRFMLMVDSSDVRPALDGLRAANLPRAKFAAVPDLLKSDALVTSPAEDRQRAAYALGQALAATLSGMEGVLDARVHIVLAEKSTPLSKPSPPSAAVAIKHRASFNLKASRLAIQNLVARSVDGLKAENVSILFEGVDSAATSPRLQERSPWTGYVLAKMALGALVCMGLAVGYAWSVPGRRHRRLLVQRVQALWARRAGAGAKV